MAKRSTSVDTTSDNIGRDGKDTRVVYWLNEISAARKREKDWRKEGQRILDIYSGKRRDETPFNILFSNTETLLPALYSAIPRPVVQRRFKDEDPIGRSAATAGQRALEFLVDTNVDGYETYDEGMRSATLDGLLPGRGLTCVKYDAEIGVLPTESVDDETPDSEDAKPQPATDQAGDVAQPDEYKASELVCVETRSWNRVYMGYAKKWSKVPWIAYEEQIDREEGVRLFGEAVASKLVYSANEEDGEEEGHRETEDEKNRGERKTATIYQIWDKDGGKKIRYISPQYNDGFLKVEDDPLQLTGFFNCPKPLQFVEKSNDLTPVALYCLYENQAKELNRLSVRINHVVQAIKARGVYDSELGEDIANLMKAEDNALVPADKSSSLAAEKGLQNAIWFMPIEQLIATLMQLYQAREQCKRVIYEITGISDIIRGSSVASETATAQNLKSQWGTLRLKRLQKEVQRYSRDLLRMMLEIAATKFSEETWAKMTGLPFLTTQQKMQFDGVAQAARMQVAEMQAVGQPPSPQMQQQMKQLQAEMSKPVWAQVLEVLRDDMQRAYRIDIETNSTIEPEAAEDQKNISEMMTAMGQFLNGVGPLVAKGVMPFGAAQSMLLAIARRFRFGTEIEEYIKQMQAPKPEDDGKAAAAQKEMLSKDAKIAQMTVEAEKRNAEAEIAKRESAVSLKEIKLEAEQRVFDMEKKAAQEAITLRDKVGQERLAGEQKIASLQNTKFKQENVVNNAAGTKLNEGVKAVERTMAQIAPLRQEMLARIEAQGREFSQKLEEVKQEVSQTIARPRRRIPIRGKDGRITEIRDEMA